MEPTVRSPWIESAIITDRVRNVAFGLPTPQKILGSRTGSGRRKPCRGERNFWMQRLEAKNRPQRPQGSPETERLERYQRKSPQKPVLSQPGNLQFGGTGWWRQSGSKLSAHHPVIERVSRLSQERKFSMQRLSGETGLFAASLPAETAQIRKLGAHVFEIFIAIRV